VASVAGCWLVVRHYAARFGSIRLLADAAAAAFDRAQLPSQAQPLVTNQLGIANGGGAGAKCCRADYRFGPM
jgi:hypothetical protein